MPGFVDVSMMSDKQIKHLCQQDEDMNFRPNFRPTYRKTSKPVAEITERYSADDVWAAAYAANNVNNGLYHKTDIHSENGIKARSNRSIMMQYLKGELTLSESDRQGGRNCKEYLRGKILFDLLKGKTLNDFQFAVNKACELVEFTNLNYVDISVVASQPAAYIRSLASDEINVKARQGKLIGTVGDKISGNITVLKSVYSQNYGVFFITAQTIDSDIVFFSYKNELQIGTKFYAAGTVKRHTPDNTTQLNRVKLVRLEENMVDQ